MDIADIGTIAETFTMTLRHPVSGEVLLGLGDDPMTITVAGRDSRVYRRFMFDRQQADFDAAAQSPDGKPPRLTPDERDARVRDLLAACTVEWTIVLHGKTPNVKDAAKVYAEYQWIADQVDAAIHRRANFLPASSAT